MAARPCSLRPEAVSVSCSTRGQEAGGSPGQVLQFPATWEHVPATAVGQGVAGAGRQAWGMRP